MGFLNQLYRMFQGVTPNLKLLIVGLDASGKTSILKKLQPREDLSTIAPTIGAQVEEFYSTIHKIKFTAYDMSGQGKYRQLWDSYIKDVSAIIYVIDTTDRARFAVAASEFQELLTSAALRAVTIPVLVFANKIDVPGAADPLECS